MERKYFIFRCKCCGATFYKSASECTGFKSATLNEPIAQNIKPIHVCDKSTSLLGIGELIGATDYGYTGD